MNVDMRTESLRLAARLLTGTGEDTDATLRGFQSEIAGLGQPWGDDELGLAIGTIYQGALAMVMNCLTSNLDTLDGYGERLNVAADHQDGHTMQLVPTDLHDAIRHAGGVAVKKGS